MNIKISKITKQISILRCYAEVNNAAKNQKLTWLYQGQKIIG